MGAPMARRLAATHHLHVYSRSAASRRKVTGPAVVTHAECDDFFQASDAALLMLRDETAVDDVLGRGTAAFGRRVGGKLIVLMGTHPPAFSAALARDIKAAHGRYVEAPVSGSAAAAADGQLAIMLAGDQSDVDDIQPCLALLGPVRRYLGPVPNALSCKLAVNCYLISTVAALSEALVLAEASGVDRHIFAEVIGDGPLGSQVARSKLAKMLARDFAPQASIADVCRNAELVSAAAPSVSLRMLELARERFDALRDSGCGHEDMAAVIKSVEAELPHE